MKMDLLTNATVVDDAIRFVARKSKDEEKIKSSTANNDSEYNSVKDISSVVAAEEETTTNQVF